MYLAFQRVRDAEVVSLAWLGGAEFSCLQVTDGLAVAAWGRGTPADPKELGGDGPG